MIDSLLAALGVKKLPILVAGAVGGLISLRHYSDLTYKGRFLVILSSVALANYLTRPIVVFFGETAQDFELGIAAGVGLFGLSIVSSITNLVSDTGYWKGIVHDFFDGFRK